MYWNGFYWFDANTFNLYDDYGNLVDNPEALEEAKQSYLKGNSEFLSMPEIFAWWNAD